MAFPLCSDYIEMETISQVHKVYIYIYIYIIISPAVLQSKTFYGVPIHAHMNSHKVHSSVRSHSIFTKCSICPVPIENYLCPSESNYLQAY